MTRSRHTVAPARCRHLRPAKWGMVTRWVSSSSPRARFSLASSAEPFPCAAVRSPVMVVSRALSMRGQFRRRRAFRISPGRLGGPRALCTRAAPRLGVHPPPWPPIPPVAPISSRRCGPSSSSGSAVPVHVASARRTGNPACGRARRGRRSSGLSSRRVNAFDALLSATWSAIVAFVHSALDQRSGGPTEPRRGSLRPGPAAAGLPPGLSCSWPPCGSVRGKAPTESKALTWTVRGLGLCLVGLGIWSAIRLGLWWTGVHDPSSRKAADSVSGCQVREEPSSGYEASETRPRGAPVFADRIGPPDVRPPRRSHGHCGFTIAASTE